MGAFPVLESGGRDEHTDLAMPGVDEFESFGQGRRVKQPKSTLFERFRDPLSHRRVDIEQQDGGNRRALGSRRTPWCRFFRLRLHAFAETFHFRQQRCALDLEQVGGTRLIAAGEDKRLIEQRELDAAHDLIEIQTLLRNPNRYRLGRCW